MTVADSYDSAAAAWAAGPAAVYARLAEAMLDRSPVPLAGAGVLDVGAGTAVVAEVAGRRGALWTLAVDVAPGMLRLRSPGIAAVLGDAARLPLRDRCLDLVAAGFCLSHLPDPRGALVEWRRVGRSLVASAFAPGPPHPAKAAVDDAMAELGFVSPEWYRQLKGASERIEDAQALAGLVRDAGYDPVEVTVQAVDAGLEGSDDLVRWRLGMAHLAPWVAGLSEAGRAQAVEAARRAVDGLGLVTIDVLVVSGS
jgi:ubiquinone/menaquinone biosynthesis C-methylase UbiE